MKGNPNPVQTPEFKAKQFKAFGEVSQPLSSRVLGIKLPIDIDRAVFSLPPKERVPWVRRVITEAAQRELMSPSPEESRAIAHPGTTPSPAADISPSSEMTEQPTKRKRGRPRKTAVESKP